ncbi:MAG: hypothetical protein QOE87_3945 [Gaiellales bacterium]|jgi:hypothetical protein|nr:hypothetical protein [Gaiellales bacterium]
MSTSQGSGVSAAPVPPPRGCAPAASGSTAPGAPDARLPWGGLKTSGIGRELRFAGIEGNTEEKTVTITF